MSPRNVDKAHGGPATSPPQPESREPSDLNAGPAVKNRVRNQAKHSLHNIERQSKDLGDSPSHQSEQPVAVAESQEKSTQKSASFLPVVPSTPSKRQYPTSNKLGSSSQYLGITLHGLTGKWQAHFQGKYIGLFETEIEAAEARWQKSQEQQEHSKAGAATPITELLAGKKAKLTLFPTEVIPKPTKRPSPTKATVPQTGTGESASKHSITNLFSSGGQTAMPRAAHHNTPKLMAKTPAGSVLDHLSLKKQSSAQQVVAQPLASAHDTPSMTTPTKKTVVKQPMRKRRLDGEGVSAPQHTVVDQNSVDERAPEQQSRMDRLEDATQEEEALMPRWIHTFHKWMLARETKENTVKSYLAAFRLLYEEDRKSLAAMATQEYWQLTRATPKDARCRHRRSSSIGLWSEFFCDHKAKMSPLESESNAPIHRIRGRDEFQGRRHSLVPRQEPAEKRPRADDCPHDDATPASSEIVSQDPSTQLSTAVPATKPLDSDDRSSASSVAASLLTAEIDHNHRKQEAAPTRQSSPCLGPEVNVQQEDHEMLQTRSGEVTPVEPAPTSPQMMCPKQDADAASPPPERFEVTSGTPPPRATGSRAHSEPKDGNVVTPEKPGLLRNQMLGAHLAAEDLAKMGSCDEAVDSTSALPCTLELASCEPSSIVCGAKEPPMPMEEKAVTEEGSQFNVEPSACVLSASAPLSCEEELEEETLEKSLSTIIEKDVAAMMAEPMAVDLPPSKQTGGDQFVGRLGSLECLAFSL